MTKKNDTSANALQIINALDELGSVLPLATTRVEHFERSSQDITEYRTILERLEALPGTDKNERIKGTIHGLKYDLQRVKEI